MKWEKLPNGKWKPIKETRGRNKDGKYSWDDPIFIKKQNLALEKIVVICDSCGEFNMSNPCIHHLPDGYQNDMRRRAYYKKLKEDRNSSYIAKTEQESISSKS